MGLNKIIMIRRRNSSMFQKTYRPGEIRGIVDHYLDEQRQETDQGNYYPDDLIIAAILDIIHAG